MADEGWGQISQAHQPASTGSALWCHPGEVQDLLSQVLEGAGSVLPSIAASEGWGQLCTILSSLLMVVSGAMDNIAMNPDMGPDISTALRANDATHLRPLSPFSDMSLFTGHVLSLFPMQHRTFAHQSNA